MSIDPRILCRFVVRLRRYANIAPWISAVGVCCSAAALWYAITVDHKADHKVAEAEQRADQRVAEAQKKADRRVAEADRKVAEANNTLAVVTENARRQIEVIGQEYQKKFDTALAEAIRKVNLTTPVAFTTPTITPPKHSGQSIVRRKGDRNGIFNSDAIVMPPRDQVVMRPLPKEVAPNPTPPPTPAAQDSIPPFLTLPALPVVLGVKVIETIFSGIKT